MSNFPTKTLAGSANIRTTEIGSAVSELSPATERLNDIGCRLHHLLDRLSGERPMDEATGQPEEVEPTDLLGRINYCNRKILIAIDTIEGFVNQIEDYV